MKRTTFLRALILALATLTALCLLTACSASTGEAMPDDRPAGNSAPSADGMEGGKTESGSGGYLDGNYERKIIRTVHMTCETKAYDDALTVIMTALSAHEGFVEASSSTGTGYTDVKGSARHAEYTLRIPAEKLDTFLESLRVNEGIRILKQSATSDEITATYYDTVSRLETLEAEKASLTAMLEGFTDYSDISAMLEVQKRLYNVIEEIEALQTKLNLYDGQVSMSTVYLILNEVITYTEVVTAEPTFGERISEAFTDSWAEFGEGCQDFAVWFVKAFPTLLVLAVIGGGILTVVIILNRKAEARRLVLRESIRNQQKTPNPKPPYRPVDHTDER